MIRSSGSKLLDEIWQMLKRIFGLIRLRFSRGFSISRVGPNEARILFDLAVAVASAIAALVFCWVAATQPVDLHRYAPLASSVLLPALFLVCNFIFGVYTRFRLSLSRVKSVVLFSSIMMTGLIVSAIFRSYSVVALWIMLASGPIVLSRLLLSIHTDRHRTLSRITENQGGPVLVIGGAGYIGSHTVEQLLKSGRDVRVLDRLMYGGSPLSEFESNPHFSMIVGDATDIAKLTLAMKGCSAVIHLAGLVGDPACAVDADFTRHTNTITTRMAREVAEAMGITRFIFASSCSVYGVSDTEVSETAQLRPVSLYAQTKIDSEQELLANATDDFFVTVLRFATVFGHSRRPRFDLVGNLFTAQALADGRITVIGPDQWRPFIHVRDLARAMMAVLNADPKLVQSQIFNVGDRRLNMTILQLAERIKEVIKPRSEVLIHISDNVNDRRNYAVSFDKIRNTLGFEASMSLEAGVQEIVDHFSKHVYRDYRSSEYSNVAMTAKALEDFRDPVQVARMYAPLG